MSSKKAILIGISILSLLIPFSVGNAQFTITGSDGTKVIGESSDSSASTTGDVWTRSYNPGEQEKDFRQAQKKERVERQTAEDKRVNEEKQLNRRGPQVIRKG